MLALTPEVIMLSKSGLSIVCTDVPSVFPALLGTLQPPWCPQHMHPVTPVWFFECLGLGIIAVFLSIASQNQANIPKVREIHGIMSKCVWGWNIDATTSRTLLQNGSNLDAKRQCLSTAVSGAW